MYLIVSPEVRKGDRLVCTTFHLTAEKEPCGALSMSTTPLYACVVTDFSTRALVAGCFTRLLKSSIVLFFDALSVAVLID